jgi:hypothetical protein
VPYKHITYFHQIWCIHLDEREVEKGDEESGWHILIRPEPSEPWAGVMLRMRQHVQGPLRMNCYHPPLVSGVLPCLLLMWWADPQQVVGGDVVPTSLNWGERQGVGHGHVAHGVPLVDGWSSARVQWYEPECDAMPNTELRNGAKCGKGHAMGFSNAKRHSSHSAENKPCCRQVGGCASNMIYHD